MLQSGLPVGVGVDEVELVAAAEVVVLVLVAQHVVAVEHGRLVHQVGAGLVEGYGVGGGQDTQVGDDGGIVVVPQSHSGDTFITKLTWK